MGCPWRYWSCSILMEFEDRSSPALQVQGCSRLGCVGRGYPTFPPAPKHAISECIVISSPSCLALLCPKPGREFLGTQNLNSVPGVCNFLETSSPLLRLIPWVMAFGQLQKQETSLWCLLGSCWLGSEWALRGLGAAHWEVEPKVQVVFVCTHTGSGTSR